MCRALGDSATQDVLFFKGLHPSSSFTLPCSLADCPQIQCVHPYVAQQPDELSLELADVLNILDKTDDGMGMGWGRDGMG